MAPWKNHFERGVRTGERKLSFRSLAGMKMLADVSGEWFFLSPKKRISDVRQSCRKQGGVKLNGALHPTGRMGNPSEENSVSSLHSGLGF